jgi:hypothetical protein
MCRGAVLEVQRCISCPDVHRGERRCRGCAEVQRSCISAELQVQRCMCAEMMHVVQSCNCMCRVQRCMVCRGSEVHV